MKGKITNSLKSQIVKLLQYISYFLRFVPQKSKLSHFSFKFSVKIYSYAQYGYCVVLDSVSFWDAENYKSQSWGSFSLENCFCNQQMFGTKSLRKKSKDNRKLFKINSGSRSIMCTNFSIISYILQSYPSKWAISVAEMHRPI